MVRKVSHASRNTPVAGEPGAGGPRRGPPGSPALPLPGLSVNDLTDKEQRAVRTALRFLRLRVGAWAPLAKALRYEYDSVQKVAAGKKAVTPALALRVARLAGVGVGMDELLGSARTAGTRPRTSSTRRQWSNERRMQLR